MNFIELREENGNKFIGNINLLKRVFITSEGKTGVVGWNNNGYFIVQETYEEVVAKVNARIAGVNRINNK